MITAPVITQRMRRVMIQSQLKKISSAIEISCRKNGGRLPSSENWIDVLLEDDERLSIDDFKLARDTFIFAYNKNVSQIDINSLPSDMVLVIECKGSKNFSGGSELASDKFQKNEIFFVLEANGQVYCILPQWVKELKWEP